MSDLEALLLRARALLDRLEPLLADTGDSPTSWDEAVAFRWSGGARLVPVRHRAPVQLADLLAIDDQKSVLDRNTRQFLRGLPANNALLWGPRGTGKSSLIKALLNEYAAAGLRVIEVTRTDLGDLTPIADRIAGRRERFVVFCDDLSFAAGDASYLALKAGLDGSVFESPANMLVYATSNRRHLLPEPLRDNDGTVVAATEIHYGEAVEERISLSERFGLWLAFHPFSQDDFLGIVAHCLGKLGIDAAGDDAIREAALQWALLRGSRSGRSAQQFARDWAGRRGLETPP